MAAEVSTKQRHHRVLAALCYCCVPVACAACENRNSVICLGGLRVHLLQKSMKSRWMGQGFLSLREFVYKMLRGNCLRHYQGAGTAGISEKKKDKSRCTLSICHLPVISFLSVGLPASKGLNQTAILSPDFLLFSGSHPPVHIKHLLTPHLHTVARLLVSKAVARANGGIIIIHSEEPVLIGSNAA